MEVKTVYLPEKCSTLVLQLACRDILQGLLQQSNVVIVIDDTYSINECIKGCFSKGDNCRHGKTVFKVNYKCSDQLYMPIMLCVMANTLYLSDNIFWVATKVHVN